MRCFESVQGFDRLRNNVLRVILDKYVNDKYNMAVCNV